MKVPRGSARRARIEMLPLIDIVFLLLVFFIYAMLSMAVHKGLPVVLPSSKTAGVDKRLLVSVTVKADGRVYVDGELVDVESLAVYLQGLPQKGDEKGALLFADRNLTYQELFEVLDQLKSGGFTNISLQAEVD
ncbi:MAG TPA: biopolymer transporter ExbD [Desulfobacteraceae bacterium]|nr:biopolymer transporter ExbD [Desulfobacteraceae bacterium]